MVITKFTDNAKPKHIGTLDIDLNLNPEDLGEYEYAELVKALEAHSYQRGTEGLMSFQLQRIIDLKDGTKPIPIIIDLLMPNDAMLKKHNPPLMDGGRFALKHYQEVTIDGVMADGRPNKVKILLATPAASLVMKGYALAGRDKQKDAYDIWFCIRNYEGGAEALAADCKPLMVDGEAKVAYTARAAFSQAINA